MSLVSENIRYLRKRNGLTQTQLAMRMGINQKSIGAYEEARATPPRETLIKISQLFGVSIDDVLKNDMRRIKDIPNLDFHNLPPLPVSTPQPIKNIIEPYFIEPEPINRVAQNITMRPLGRTDTTPERQSFKQPEPLPPTPSVRANSGIPLVRKSVMREYLQKSNQPFFISQLPLTNFYDQTDENLRAFESGDDFPWAGATLFAKKVQNYSALENGQHYLIVDASRGLMYRRVYNQLSIKNTLLLSSDQHGIQTVEISGKDIIEIWQITGFFSTVLPEKTFSVDRVQQLLDEVKRELNEAKSN